MNSVNDQAAQPSTSSNYAYINTTGQIVIDAGRYRSVGPFSDGLAAVWLANRGWGYLDKTGNFAIEPRFEQALSFSDGLAGVQIGGAWGFIDKTGHSVIDPQYEVVNSFSEDMSVVVKGISTAVRGQLTKDTSKATRGVIVRSEVREIRIPSTKHNLPEPGPPSKEVLIIDKKGQTIFSLNMNQIQVSIYDGAKFSEGLMDAYDCTTRQSGFIDKTGKFVIEPQFENAAPFLRV